MRLTEQTVCFTGHRKIPPEKLEAISRRLRAVLIQFIESGYLYFAAGGALGFDTLAAQTVLELRRQYPQIRLVLVLPCLSQPDGWSEQDRRTYMHIKGQADQVIYTSQEHTRGRMHKRNRYLADHSQACFFVQPDYTGL